MNEPIEGEQAFQLHERLARGTFLLGRLGICQLLLKDNAEFAWLLLVPETSATELHDLTEAQYHEVCAAIRKVSQFASATFQPDKLNVAAIGNQVPQLHIHIVARFKTDAAWPGTVWASDAKRPYEQTAREAIRAAADAFFGFSLSSP